MTTPHFHVETVFGGEQETIGIYDTVEEAIKAIIPGIEVNEEDGAVQWDEVVGKFDSYAYFYGCSEPLDQCHEPDSCALCLARSEATQQEARQVATVNAEVTPGESKCHLCHGTLMARHDGFDGTLIELPCPLCTQATCPDCRGNGGPRPFTDGAFSADCVRCQGTGHIPISAEVTLGEPADWREESRRELLTWTDGHGHVLKGAPAKSDEFDIEDWNQKAMEREAATGQVAGELVNIELTITPEERDTILAALRYWQTGFDAARPEHGGELMDIATNCGQHRPMHSTEIDTLCEEVING